MPRQGLEEDYLGLLFRCEIGDIEGVRLLVGEGADINWRPENKPSVLYQSVKEGNESLVQALLALGASVSSVDLYSVYKAPMLALLFRHGARADTTDKEGWSLLHSACCLGIEEVALCLIDHGADWNAVDRDGFTALKVAQHAHPSLANRLESRWQEKAMQGATVEANMRPAPRRI